MAMFKRRRFKRPFRRHGRPLARVRRTWVESVIIDPCNPLEIPLLPNLDGCVTTRWEQVVVNNQILQDQFSDRASVKRILGNLQIQFAVLQSAIDPGDVYTRLATANAAVFCQLIKRPIDAAGQTELPPDIWNTSSVISGYSEAKALKTWWHFWNGYNQFSTDVGTQDFSTSANIQTYGWRPKLETCLTDVEACISPGVLTSGSGETFEVNGDSDLGFKLVTDCEPCGAVDISGISGLHNSGIIRAPGVWNFTMDIKKSIPLREDEQLVLDFQVRTPNQFAYSDWEMIVSGGAIKTLLQF